MTKNRGFEDSYENELYLNSIRKRFSKTKNKINIELVELLNQNGNKDYYDKEMDTAIVASKNQASHPEIEDKIIQLFEKNYTGEMLDPFFCNSNYKNLKILFSEISPTYLENLSFGWYDLHKPGTDHYERTRAYKQILRFFKAYNESKSLEFWMNWSTKKTYRYCQKTKDLFENWIKENYNKETISEYSVYLKSILTEKDRNADRTHLVNMIDESIKYADEKNNQVFKPFDYSLFFR